MALSESFLVLVLVIIFVASPAFFVPILGFFYFKGSYDFGGNMSVILSGAYLTFAYLTWKVQHPIFLMFFVVSVLPVVGATAYRLLDFVGFRSSGPSEAVGGEEA